MKWHKKLFSRLRALRMVQSLKGSVSAESVTELAIAVLLVGILVPIGLLEIAQANTTGWNANVITLFQVVLPILAVIGLSIRFLSRRRNG